jgi:predicted RNA binding protein YcfA (HicA-like mRNA interferase family)
MPKLPRISSQKLIKALLKLGFYIHHQVGSHIHLKHFSKTHLRVVIPAKRESLSPKTLKSILVQAEITIEDLKKVIIINRK